MKKILLLSMTVLLSSCVAPKTIVPTFKSYSPELNKNLTAEIGQKMIDKYSIWTYEAIKINNVPDRIGFYNRILELNDNDICVLKSELKEYNLYSLYKNDIQKAHGVAVSKENGEAFPFAYKGATVEVLNKNKRYHGITYTKTEYSEQKKGNYSRQIIYNGKSGDNLKFTYREFSDDMARPAFTQDLQYDLSESKIIGFDGLRVEILKATNTEIEYKILNDFKN